MHLHSLCRDNVYIRCAVLAAFIIGAPKLAAHAHGLIQTVTQEIGNNIVELGYDTLSIEAGAPARFDLKLREKFGGAPVEFTDVWLRIEQAGAKTVFAGSLLPILGEAGAIITLPEAGSYSFSVRFGKGGEKLAEAAFPITAKVAERPEANSSPFLPLRTFSLGALVGIIVASGALWLIKKKK